MRLKYGQVDILPPIQHEVEIMEKKITYPISSNINQDSASSSSQLLVRSIMASIGGASIPAIIFYFLL